MWEARVRGKDNSYHTIYTTYTIALLHPAKFTPAIQAEMIVLVLYRYMIYTVTDKKTGTPQKKLLFLFLQLNIVDSSYEIDLISLDSPL